MWSIVRAMSASRFGLRYELQVTSAPSSRARSRRRWPRATCTPRSGRRSGRRRADRSGPRPRCCRRPGHRPRSARARNASTVVFCGCSCTPTRKRAIVSRAPCRLARPSSSSGMSRNSIRRPPSARASIARPESSRRSGSPTIAVRQPFASRLGFPCNICERSARVASTAGSRSSSLARCVSHAPSTVTAGARLRSMRSGSGRCTAETRASGPSSPPRGYRVPVPSLVERHRRRGSRTVPRGNVVAAARCRRARARRARSAAGRRGSPPCVPATPRPPARHRATGPAADARL